MSTTEQFRQALALHREGKTAEAEAAYRAILFSKPDHFGALHHLGALRAHLGDMDEAARLLGKAVTIDPAATVAHVQLGDVLAELGRTAEALARYDVALSRRADLAPLHVSRGKLLWKLGRLETAAAAFETAVMLHPGYVEALINLSNVLLLLERFEAALNAADRGVAAAPDLPLALVNRGNVLQAMSRRNEALAAFDRALERDPRFAHALVHRAQVLQELDRDSEALQDAERAIAIAPDSAEAHSHCGSILHKLKRPEEALQCYDRSIALDPDNALAHANRAGALQALRRPEEALAAYGEALARNPNDAESHCARGSLLVDAYRLEEAIAAFTTALSLKPDHVESFACRAAALRALGRLDEALADCNRATQWRPDFAAAYYNRSCVLHDLKRLDEARADCAKALALDPILGDAAGVNFGMAAMACDWRDRAESISDLVRLCREGRRVAPFVMLYAVDDPEIHLAAAKLTACPSRRIWPAGPAMARKRLRVGYLSADFRDHAVAHQAVELFERHDRARYEIYGFSLLDEAQSPIKQRLRRAFDQFIETGTRSDQEVASLMAGLQIDIAVDLGGYTDKSRPRILAYRPAPVAVNYLGYPGTLGADYVDYIIADAQVIPPQFERSYTESIARLPGCYLPVDTKGRGDRAPPSRADAGLPERGFVFCAFNNNYKLTPEMFGIWMRLLREVDGSVLWLSVGTPKARDNLRAEAEKGGVSPGRLVFADRMDERAQHLARIALADLFLDSLPYNAHSTAADMLWAGVPLVTCMGRSFPARVAGSLLTAIGAEELIARDLTEYEAMTLELARSPQRLAAIRAKLLRNRASHPLFDMARNCRHLERAYETMWDLHQKGLKPQSFAVNPTA